MKIDPKNPCCYTCTSSEEIMAMVTNIEKFADIEIINFSNLPSPHITPNMMMELSQYCQRNIVERDDITGVVVTHGTDTLEETAYLLT